MFGFAVEVTGLEPLGSGVDFGHNNTPGLKFPVTHATFQLLFTMNNIVSASDESYLSWFLCVRLEAPLMSLSQSRAI